MALISTISDVVSSDISARSGNDYHPVAHTVIFGASSNPPEAVVSFEIQVKDDNIVENDELFHLTLENINGALIGQPQKAEVQIQDNDGKTEQQETFFRPVCWLLIKLFTY